jgi:endonuclease/exonuclease/phosphatase family metal-dependent hydrolase
MGLLLGLVLDTAVHGITATYDISWHQNWGAALLVIFLVLCQWWLLGQLLAQPTDTRSSANDTQFPLAFVLLAIGPFIFLQLIVFQNIARLTTLTNWSQPLAFGWVLGAQMLGLATAIALSSIRHNKIWLVAVMFGTALLGSLIIGWPTGWLAAVFLLAGHISSAGLLTLIFLGLGAGVGYTGVSRITIGYSLGIVLMTLFIFVFYSSYDLPIPIPNTILLPLAGLVIGLAGVGAARALDQVVNAVAPLPRRLVFVLLLALLPFYTYFSEPEVTAVSANSSTIRVMTYNVHNGFDMQGNLGMEAIAQVIEAQQPDVVALQEVSRGWAMNGSIDMLAWLSQRLEMPYVFGPTADPIWGNAILSRYPISFVELVDLPTDDLPLKRGFIGAQINDGGQQPLTIIATHYHHPQNGSAVRVLQSEKILQYWAGNGRTIFMGDLNAEPGAPEIEMLRQAGFVDAADIASAGPANTYPANEPTRHIDYIWLSADLRATDFVIPPQPASDHLPISISIGQ